jgi:hypothetical protein
MFIGRNLGDVRMLNFFGDISYPLYLVHVPLAWIVLHEITRRNYSLHIAVVQNARQIALCVQDCCMSHFELECGKSEDDADTVGLAISLLSRARHFEPYQVVSDEHAPYFLSRCVDAHAAQAHRHSHHCLLDLEVARFDLPASTVAISGSAKSSSANT